MKTRTFKTSGAILRVSGNIWQGHRCEHEYSLDNKPHPKTLAEAKAIAGDFASLDKAQIVLTEREVTEKTQVVKLS